VVVLSQTRDPPFTEGAGHVVLHSAQAPRSGGHMLRKAWVGLTVALAVSACGSSGVPRCTPGVSAECTCVSGAKGAQLCDVTGVFGACTCVAGSGGGSAAGGGTASGTGGGTASAMGGGTSG